MIQAPKSKTISIVAGCVLFSLALGSCAALFRGSKDTVNFTSEPNGALVYIDGMNMGKTPLQTALEAKKSHNVEFRMDGYETRSRVLSSSVGAGWIVLDILGGIIPVVVDAATGSWNGLDDTQVSAILDKK